MCTYLEETGSNGVDYTDISQVRDQYREEGEKALSFHCAESVFKLLNVYQHFKKNCAA